MKRLSTLLFTILFLSAANSHAQMFWVENFESGSTSGLVVNSYSGLNGPWTLTINASSSAATEASKPNPWYVSCAEAGHVAGACGSVCGAGGPDLGATLHIGSNAFVGGDMGAAYYSGGACFGSSSSSSSSSSSFSLCVSTNRRAESPAINCTGQTNILLRFYYIENGETTNDDGSVWYSPDNGSSWSLLTNTAKTAVCGSGQGQWAVDTITLPASANGNPLVKIGFLWVNNDDGFGTDPSYAIDSMSLTSVAPASAPVASFTASTPLVACQDSCITFTSTSTGTIDSVHWVMPGVSITTPNANPLVLCSYPSGGIFTMHLYAYGPGGEDSASTSVTINALPTVTLTHTGDLLSTAAGYPGYEWGVGFPPTIISGATSSTYAITHSGLYTVGVDSAGCWGYDSMTVFAVGVNQVNAASNKFWLTSSGSSSVTLHSAIQLKDDLTVNIFDVSGKQLLEDNWKAGSDAKQLNSDNISPGTYLIKLNDRSNNEVLKWTKQ